MTLKDAEIINYIVESIKGYESLNGKIQELFKEGKSEEIARIALELNSELKRVYDDKLANIKIII